MNELELIKSFTSEESEEIKMLRRHAAEGESITVEFKERFPSNAKELANDIASFASSNQGFVYLGIDKKGRILGLPEIETASARDELQLRILGLTNNIQPPMQVKVDFLKVDSKNAEKILKVHQMTLTML